MIYAPILIITLNRYECLKKCIESLQRNSWVDKTELFISVDYPPMEKYVAGYKKICKYLEKDIDGFKKVHLYFHKKNLGPIGNVSWLRKMVCEEHERYILLEDDNELAPGFLEFCDKGLEQFEKDDSIIALNASDYVWCGDGYTPPVRIPAKGENNIEKRQMIFHAVAYWESKRKKAYDFCKLIEAKNGFLDLSNMIKLHKKSACMFYQFLAMVSFQREKLPWFENELQPIDFILDIYMLLNDRYVIAPIAPLQRDLGVDGNGVNYDASFENAVELKKRAWLEDKEFNFCISKNLDININELKLHDKFMKLSYSSKIKILFKYVYGRIKNKL